jgi:lipoprotein-anchoring transpeptidase ErfK/SrfK
LVPTLWLGVATIGLIPHAFAHAAPAAAAAKAAPRGGVDLKVLTLQVVLDRAGFSPGVIDGKSGASLRKAISGFQEARGLPVTGTLDQKTLALLQPAPDFEAVRTLKVDEGDASGPFLGTIPKDPALQAKLPAMGYRNLIELLAEKFHTTPATIVALNPPGTKLGAGLPLRLPNVLPPSRDYAADMKPDWKATLSNLNVGSEQPVAARVIVDKSEGALKVYDAADKLVAQFPATMGSEHDPLPIGEWTIKGASYNPPFHYNPDLFWDASDKDQKQLLPPGPNGPVGVVWLDLSKEHYGIHGTPEPQTIGRAESHGCIRLSNWDAARLALMVKPGTPAKFQA